MAFPLVSTVLIQILVQIKVWDTGGFFRGKQNSEVPKRTASTVTISGNWAPYSCLLQIWSDF